MSKKLNKQTAKLLSAVIMSSIAMAPVQAMAFENETVIEQQASVNSRATKTGTVNTDVLNVRKGAGTSYSKMGTVTRGTIVQIEDTTSNGWHKIKYGNTFGYVSGDYVKITTTSQSTTSSATTTTHTGATTAGLNVRNGGSTSHSKIGYLSKGTKVNIVDKLSNGWYKIKYGTGYGYVSGDYVTNVVSVSSSGSSSSSSNLTSSATTTTHTGTTTYGLNVRSGGSTSHSKIGYFSKGAKVNIVDKLSNGWYKVKYGTSYGYVSGDYVTNVVSVSSSDSSSSETTIKTGSVNTTALNVRSGASTGYSKIGSLSKGTKVEIVKVESNGWYKIKYGSGYGYVSGAYITIPGENNTINNLNNFLFVGDSFTVLLSNTIKSKNDNVYIHAKSGSMPGYWIDKVSSMPSNSSVDGVVLLIGVNGAGYASNKTDVKTLINKLSAKYPNKTIYVQKIFPVGRNFTNANPYTFNQKIASLNSVIESHCKTVSNAKFINTTSGFVDGSGYLLHSYDGLHISSSYNNQFYNNILNAVKNAK